MKTIFITGISRGLGLELTKDLLNKGGYTIYGISRGISPELKNLCETYPDLLHWHAFDLNNISEIETGLFENFIPKDLSIDIFINNAAILYKDLITRVDTKSLEELMRVNFTAPVILSRYIIKNFLYHNKKGIIIHISSICAHKAFEGLSLMGASKAAIEAFSRSTAFEYGRKGIRSNTIVIGLLDIGMSFTVNEKQKDALLTNAALKKTTGLSSVIQTVNMLISDQACDITAQCIHVNAGL
ncbi:MAG: SDR family oxidoreductase [Bacteroidales bacterium]|nr:SDR family oxidoreductase [Bacteroidales bacterium]